MIKQAKITSLFIPLSPHIGKNSYRLKKMGIIFGISTQKYKNDMMITFLQHLPLSPTLRQHFIYSRLKVDL